MGHNYLAAQGNRLHMARLGLQKDHQLHIFSQMPENSYDVFMRNGTVIAIVTIWKISEKSLDNHNFSATNNVSALLNHLT